MYVDRSLEPLITCMELRWLPLLVRYKNGDKQFQHQAVVVGSSNGSSICLYARIGWLSFQTAGRLNDSPRKGAHSLRQTTSRIFLAPVPSLLVEFGVPYSLFKPTCGCLLKMNN